MLLGLHNELLQQVLEQCPCPDRGALSLACNQLCTGVRTLSACCLGLRGHQGHAVAALPPSRQFRGCTSLTYTCSTTLALQRQQSPAQQQQAASEQLAALGALLQRALHALPQLSTVTLHITGQIVPRERQGLLGLHQGVGACLSALRPLPCLTSLTLHLPVEFSCTQVEALGALTQLQQLTLDMTVQGDQQLQLEPLSRLVNLTSFNCQRLAPTAINGSSSSSSDAGSDGSSCLPPGSLTRLILGGSHQQMLAWWPHVTAALAAVCSQHLEVGTIQGRAAQELLQQLAAAAPHLRQLHLHFDPNLWAPCAALGAFTALEVLQVTGSQAREMCLLNAQDWHRLAGCQSLIHLSAINICWSLEVRLPPAGFQLPRLRKASVRLLRGTSGQQLAALLRCFPALEELSLKVSLAPAAQQQQQQQRDEEKEAAGASQHGSAGPYAAAAVAQPLPPVRLADIQVMDGTDSPSEVAVLLQCLPHLQSLRLEVGMAADQPLEPQQQQQTAPCQQSSGAAQQEDAAAAAAASGGQLSLQQQQQHETLEAPVAGAEQHQRPPATEQRLQAPLTWTAAAAAQELGLSYVSSPPPAPGPLKILRLKLCPARRADNVPGTTATGSEQLQRTLRGLAPLFASVLSLILDLTRVCAPLPDLSCFPQLVGLDLIGGERPAAVVQQVQAWLVNMPQLWHLTIRGGDMPRLGLSPPAYERAQSLKALCLQFTGQLQQGGQGAQQRLLSAVNAVVAAEVGPWRDLLQQLEEVEGRGPSVCQAMRQGVAEVEAAAAALRAAGATSHSCRTG